MATDQRSQRHKFLCRFGGHLVVMTCLTASAGGEDSLYPRLTMVDNSTETGMRDCIKQAAAAASQEDLDAYLSCFTDSRQKPMRRNAAMLFVRHVVTLELLDCHLVEVAGTHATLAIKYKAVLSGDGYEVVSLVHMENENGTWRISRERIETREKSVPVCDSSPRTQVACAGGRCRLVAE